MSAVIMTIKPEKVELVRPFFQELGQKLMILAQVHLGVPDLKDKEFQVHVPIFQMDMCDVEVCVDYSHGGDEYKTGTPFEPSEDQRQSCVDHILRTLREILKLVDIKTAYVWIRGFTNTTFEEREFGLGPDFVNPKMVDDFRTHSIYRS